MTVLMQFVGYKSAMKRAGYDGWFEVDTISFQPQRSLRPSDVVVARTLDSFSYVLYRKALDGTVFREINMHFLDDQGKPAMKYELERVQITSYQVGGSHDGPPMEIVTLAPERMSFER